MRAPWIPCLLALLAFSAIATSVPTDPYKEHLHVRSLPGGYLYAGFNFTSRTPLAEYNTQHYRYFPRSLAQILQFTHTQELHLRFAAGRWDEEEWGSRPRRGSREGGTGVELWAWISQNVNGSSVDQRWDGLVNSLSGLFCASLNFIDGTKTTRPVLTFAPEGDLGEEKNALALLHGMLPHEVVCTENLTPFLKLLPCKGKAGIGSLLDGHKVFDANWQTMSIDVRRICSATGDCAIEIQQTVDMVLDIERSMRPRQDPIPRPPPVEDVECDETKSYHGHDTCYPKARDYELSWTLSGIFGQALKGNCPLSNKGAKSFDFTLEVPKERQVVQLIDGQEITNRSIVAVLDDRRQFIVPGDSHFDVSLPRQVLTQQDPARSQTPSLLVSRQMTGYGQERGGMHVRLINPHLHAQRVIYYESLPWFLRPYMHTLKVKGGKTKRMFYIPAIDRRRGTQLELLIEIPASGVVDLTFDVEKAILRYTEYPPDANRGFDVPSAIIRILADGELSEGLSSYMRTTNLLLPLPTPDFSMPYNVIILTSTVIALGFGSIFNLLVRRFVLVDEVPDSLLVMRIKFIVNIIRERLQKARSPATSSDPKTIGKKPEKAE